MDAIIPDNIAGKENDLHYTIVFSTKEEAVNCFERARKRLLNPLIWHELSGTLSPSFTLRDTNSNVANRLAEVSDYFQIDVPFLGNRGGAGHDWVRVADIADILNPTGDEERFAMTLAVSPAPGSITNEVAHFLRSGATSTFTVERHNNDVTANYYGRNEVPNTDTGSVLDNVRNAIVAGAGIIGLSEGQWYALLESLLQEELGG